MFEAELARAATFKKIVTAFQDFVTEAAFDCSDEGMSLQASDDHGTIVTFNMDQKAFLGYQCDRIITIGINLNWLSNILKCAADDDIMTIKAVDGKGEVSIIFEPKKMNEKTEYVVEMVKVDHKNIDILDIEYPVTIKMPTQRFQRIYHDLSKIGDKMEIVTHDTSISFCSTGKTGSVDIELSEYGHSKEYKMRIGIEDMGAYCKMDRLAHLEKATPLADQVKLLLPTYYDPIVVEYAISKALSGREEVGHIRYYLPQD